MAYHVTMVSQVTLRLDKSQLSYLTKERIENDLPFLMGAHVKKPKSLKHSYPGDNPNKITEYKHFTATVTIDDCLAVIDISCNYAADGSVPRKLAHWYKRLIKDLTKVYGAFEGEPVTKYDFEAECMGVRAKLSYFFEEVYESVNPDVLLQGIGLKIGYRSDATIDD